MLFSFFRSKKAKQHAADLAAQQCREGLTQLQRELGERAYQAIKKATLSNLVHGQQQRNDAGPMWVGNMPENGGRYSITVYLHGTSGWSGNRTSTQYFALQFDIGAA